MSSSLQEMKSSNYTRIFWNHIEKGGSGSNKQFSEIFDEIKELTEP